MADVLTRLGDVPARRVRMHPVPGTATEADVIAAELRQNRLCELVDGTLVEKVMAIFESRVAGCLFRYLDEHLESHDFGFVTGADGMLRISPGLVRIPDVAVVLWTRFPQRNIPKQPIGDWAPDLAIEAFSQGNTAKEMSRNVREFFDAGCKLVWIIYPTTRIATVYTSPKDVKELSETDSLTGEPVLPGFSLSLSKLIARAEGRRE